MTRSSGILLHPTSLPGRHGIGDLGAEAYRFVDFLSETGQSVWQILPLGPTGYGDSPYSAFSAFAGNPLLISLDELAKTGDLDAETVSEQTCPAGAADYGFAHRLKERLLPQAAARFRTGSGPRQEAYRRFCQEQAYWLNDYALFRALRRHFDRQPWNRWPLQVRSRQEPALHHWGKELARAVDDRKYAQFVFFEQWFALKDYANQRGIRILGDMPIFVAFDSADVWANPHLFHLDEDLQPTLVAGVPPDYFSAAGQRWGNPLYRWEAMADEGFSLWLARFRWNLAQTDMVRIDHFRGFEACWAIPAAEPTAVNGHWLPAPGAELFETLQQALGDVPVIAEDLGVITPEVEALRDRFSFPGMKVLQFAFGSGSDNPYLPHNLTRNCVVYTGTHDNATTLGWWRSLPADVRQAVRSYLGTSGRHMPWELNRAALASVAALCILPLQDVLCLDDSARMNTPGNPSGNWRWRFVEGALTDEVKRPLAELCRCYGRSFQSN